MRIIKIHLLIVYFFFEFRLLLQKLTSHVCNLLVNTTRRYYENKPTPTVNLPTIVRVRSKTEPKNVNKSNKMNRQRIGGITLDYFMVLVCVVVIGIPVLAYAIWKCPHVNRPIFACYRLMISERTATQGKQTVSGDNQQREPLAVKLTGWNKEEQV